MYTPKVWFNTQGDVAVATLRRPEVLSNLATRYSKEKLLVLKVDVTKQEDIDHAFARTKEVFGRLDVVFNNASYLMIGELEGTPTNDARVLFDVNSWGLVNVSRTAVQFFRELNNSGKVLVTTVRSKDPHPLLYKGPPAVEGFSESLPSWNIKICIIEPGAFNTNGHALAVVLPSHPAYEMSAGARSCTAFLGVFDEDPDKFTKTVYRMATANDIPLSLPLGHDALGAMEAEAGKLSTVAIEAAPWSADLKKDGVKSTTSAFA